MSENTSNKKIPKFLKITGIIAGVGLALYSAGAIYFSMYTYPNTTINGNDVSFKKTVEIANGLEKNNISIKTRDGKTIEYNPWENGMSAKYEKPINIAQNYFAWPAEILQAHSYETKIIPEYDNDKIVKWLDSSELIKGVTEPKNAEIVKKDGMYSVQKEVMGNKVDKEKTIDAIKTSFFNLKDSVQLKDEYINPTVYEKDLVASAAKFNEYKDVKLNIAIGEKKELLENADVFINTNTMQLDKNYVIKYVDGLKEKYDTLGKVRDFKTSKGSTVKIGGGNFGIRIDKNKTVDLLMKEIEAKKSGDIAAVLSNTAKNNGNIGNTYIEISIASQRMWFYKDGKLQVETPVVTGQKGRHNTPKGVWNVWIKQTSRRLRGFNDDGTKYDVPVNYWMQVDYSGVGIHDAWYRGAYGGNIYRYNGSHGCINTPLSKVRAIYKNVELGTPVIIW